MTDDRYSDAVRGRSNDRAVDDQPLSRLRRLHVVAVRHGESVWNAERRVQGQHGPGLTAAGRRQAELTARFLHTSHPAFDAVLSSDLQRVEETAEPWCAVAGSQVTKEPRLREIDNGAWSGLPVAQVHRQWADDVARIRRGEDLRRGGGESFADVRARIRDLLGELAAAVARQRGGEDYRVLAFTHGGPIRVFAAEVLGLPEGGHRALHGASNCSVTEALLAIGEDGKVAVSQLVSYDSHGHLAGAGPTGTPASRLAS